MAAAVCGGVHCMARALSTLLRPSKLRTAANLGRVVLSYAQCMSTFGRFERVHWPPLFGSFLRFLERFTIELFELIPADCALDEPISFFGRLVVTLGLPVATALLVSLLAAAVLPRATRNDKERSTLGRLVESPQVWTLLTWLLLLQYPLLCRASLGTFDCVSLRDETFLRSDVREKCSGTSWRGYAALSAGGVAVYCIGLPLTVFLAARRNHDSDDPQAQQKVASLVGPYRASMWWWEAVDLLRKFILTAVILQIEPSTRLQILFGAFISLCSFGLHVMSTPFSSKLVQTAQTASLLQLVITYMAAQAFFDSATIGRGDGSASTELEDIALVLLNLLCFCTILFAALRSAVVVVQEATGLVLLHPDGRRVQLQSPREAGGWHIFLSHQWTFGQDAMATLKSMLQLLMPNSQVFLDVDSLESTDLLEDYVKRSDMVLIFLAKKYVASPNCRREMLAAARHAKPTVVLRETDFDKGGVTLATAEDELTLSGADPAEAATVSELLRATEVVDFHREKPFKYAAIRRIAEKLVELQLTHAATAWGQQPPQPLRLRIRDQLSVPTSTVATRVLYLSRYYKMIPSADPPDGVSMFMLVTEALRPYGVRVQTKRRHGAPALLMLCPGVFDSVALVDEIKLILNPPPPASAASRARAGRASLTRQQSRARLSMAVAQPRRAANKATAWLTRRTAPELPPICVYSTRQPFSYYMSACPTELKEAKIFTQLFDKLPETMLMRDVAAQMIVSKLPQPQQGGLAPIDPVDDHDDEAENGDHGIEANSGNNEAGRGGAPQLPHANWMNPSVSALPKPGPLSKGAASSSSSEAAGAGLDMLSTFPAATGVVTPMDEPVQDEISRNRSYEEKIRSSTYGMEAEDEGTLFSRKEESVRSQQSCSELGGDGRENVFRFAVGDRVVHGSHGPGEVVELIEDGRTCVRFDTGEAHRYKPSSIDKLLPAGEVDERSLVVANQHAMRGLRRKQSLLEGWAAGTEGESACSKDRPTREVKRRGVLGEWDA